MIRRNPQPYIINLDGIITLESMQKAADFLVSGQAAMPVKLILDNNLIADSWLNILLDALKSDNCTNDLEISLAYTHITDVEMHAFARIFKAGVYPTGLKLNFSSNLIGNPGLIAIAESLTCDTTKRPGVYFDFQFNPPLTSDGVLHLSDMLATNLITDGVGFNLQSNPGIGHEAARELVKNLTTNTAITALAIETNDPDMDNLADIAGDLRYDFTSQNYYQFDIKFCCERNRLLQKYRHDPDVVEYIRHYAKAAKHEVLHAKQHVPSLSFFAAKKVFREDFDAFGKRYPGGLEKLHDIFTAMADVSKKLGPEPRLRGCPWSCSIL